MTQSMPELQLLGGFYDNYPYWKGSITITRGQ